LFAGTREAEPDWLYNFGGCAVYLANAPVTRANAIDEPIARNEP
jgi:hypothetical protein